jgi:hypothetical protein
MELESRWILIQSRIWTAGGTPSPFWKRHWQRMPDRNKRGFQGKQGTVEIAASCKLILWSGRRGSNPRRPAWEIDSTLKIKNIGCTALIFDDQETSCLCGSGKTMFLMEYKWSTAFLEFHLEYDWSTPYPKSCLISDKNTER